MSAKKDQRRANRRSAPRATAKTKPADGEEQADQRVRSVVVGSEVIQAEFGEFLRGKNPLRDLIMQQLIDLHGVAQQTPVMLAGIIINVIEQVDGETPEPSRIVRPPAGFSPKKAR